MKKKDPLMNSLVFLKGMFAGIILAGSILLTGYLTYQLLLFVFFILITLDVLIPAKPEQYFPLTAILGMVIGFVISTGTLLSNVHYVLIFAVGASLLYYLYKISREIAKRL